MSRSFVKMNGLGNDFVVVESRSGAPFAPDAQAVRAIADRASGIGCDQLIGLETSGKADAFMRIWNADGQEVSACGNAARCVGWLLMEASGGSEARIETRAGVLLAEKRVGAAHVTLDMGRPGLRWNDIPMAEEMDTRGIELAVGPPDKPIMHTPGCVSIGNPHVVFFVPDAEAAPVGRVGPLIERHPLFPEGVNVGFAQVLASDRIRLRVWERGAGLTKACGTGACAAVVAAARRNKAGRRVDVVLDGGALHIDWRERDDHLIMTGPVALEFTGVLP